MDMLLDLSAAIHSIFNTKLPYEWILCNPESKDDIYVLVNSTSYLIIYFVFIAWLVQTALDRVQRVAGFRMTRKDNFIAMMVFILPGSQLLWQLFLLVNYFLTCKYYPWATSAIVLCLYARLIPPFIISCLQSEVKKRPQPRGEPIQNHHHFEPEITIPNIREDQWETAHKEHFGHDESMSVIHSRDSALEAIRRIGGRQGVPITYFHSLDSNGVEKDIEDNSANDIENVATAVSGKRMDMEDDHRKVRNSDDVTSPATADKESERKTSDSRPASKGISKLLRRIIGVSDKKQSSEVETGQIDKTSTEKSTDESSIVESGGSKKPKSAIRRAFDYMSGKRSEKNDSAGAVTSTDYEADTSTSDTNSDSEKETEPPKDTGVSSGTQGSSMKSVVSDEMLASKSFFQKFKNIMGIDEDTDENSFFDEKAEDISGQVFRKIDLADQERTSGKNIRLNTFSQRPTKTLDVKKDGGMKYSVEERNSHNAAESETQSNETEMGADSGISITGSGSTEANTNKKKSEGTWQKIKGFVPGVRRRISDTPEITENVNIKRLNVSSERLQRTEARVPCMRSKPKKGYCGRCWKMDNLPFKPGFSTLRELRKTRTGTVYGPPRHFLTTEEFFDQYAIGRDDRI